MCSGIGDPLEKLEHGAGEGVRMWARKEMLKPKCNGLWIIIRHNLRDFGGETNAFKAIVIILDFSFRKKILVTVENMHGVYQEIESLHASEDDIL